MRNNSPDTEQRGVVEPGQKTVLTGTPPKTERRREGAGNVLLVSNFDSDVGFAWWLIEEYWAEIAWGHGSSKKIFLAYPSISRIPERIEKAPIECVELDFADESAAGQARRETFLREHSISHVYWTDGPLLARCYARFRRAGVERIILHSHRPALPTNNNGLRRTLKRWLHRWSRLSADDYIAVSPFVENSLERNAGVPPEKLICVGSGIDSGRLDRQTQLDLMLPPADVRIAMMGRLDPGKGVGFAIDVVRRLRDLEAEDVERNGKRTLPRIRVIHIGAGSLDQPIAARIRQEGLEDHFTLLGYQENVGAILRECQIGFHPSEGEVGYSLAILEMFSQKLPVLLPDLESVHASIREAKCWEAYRDRDVDDAARKLIELATDSERRTEMGRAGRALVAENFEFDRSLDVFRERVVPLFGRSATRRLA